MLSRKLASSLSKGLSQAARAAVPRAPFLAHAVPATQRWGSTNFPATSFLNPTKEVDADVQRVGQHGPVRNLDIKESTVELSAACEFNAVRLSCALLLPANVRDLASHSACQRL